ncbi:MAG: hypothetical protein IMZ53_02955 [Thermoplasmata archaeon]|nr:hypothetical protein [Thermoplasmata archaeon]
MSKEGTTKEKVASLCTDMKWLKEQFTNHLAHHWAFTLCLIGVLLTQSVALVVFLIKSHFVIK